jgi:hypothetical protein
VGGVRVGGEHRYDMHGHNPKGEGEVGSARATQHMHTQPKTQPGRADNNVRRADEATHSEPALLNSLMSTARCTRFVDPSRRQKR